MGLPLQKKSKTNRNASLSKQHVTSESGKSSNIVVQSKLDLPAVKEVY